MSTANHIPNEAFRFLAPAELVQAEAGAPRKLRGVAYSGDVVTGHPYWSAVVFDLSTTRAAGERLPVLIDHDRSQRAGVTGLSIDGSHIALADARLIENEAGRAVAADADQGFPWQLSVHIQPGRIEEVQPGVKVAINGREITGPVTVFRDAIVREVSLTPTGADHQTHAAVFAAANPSTQRDQGDLFMSANANQGASDHEVRISQLEADLAAANTRAETAETALSEMRLSVRREAIRTLFATLGREHSDEAAKPYFDLSDEAFAAVSADLIAAKPKAPSHLFRAEAERGQPVDDNPATKLDFAAIYAARRAAA